MANSYRRKPLFFYRRQKPPKAFISNDPRIGAGADGHPAANQTRPSVRTAVSRRPRFSQKRRGGS
jgi:hypothetical protein